MVDDSLERDAVLFPLRHLNIRDVRERSAQTANVGRKEWRDTGRAACAEIESGHDAFGVGVFALMAESGRVPECSDRGCGAAPIHDSSQQWHVVAYEKQRASINEHQPAKTVQPVHRVAGEIRSAPSGSQPCKR